MRKIKGTAIISILAASFLWLNACGEIGNTAVETALKPSTDLEAVKEVELNSDGTYTPKSGNRYVGIRIAFEDGEDWQFYTICNGDTVIDCGVNSMMSELTVKDDFIGKSYKDAFIDFFKFHSQYDDHGIVKEIQLMTPEGGDSENEYASVLKELAKEIAPKADTGYMGEDKERFIERISIYTEGYAARVAEAKGEIQREKEREEERQRQLKEEEERKQAEKAEEEWRTKPVTSVAEIRERLDKGIDEVTLAGDIVIDVGADSLEGVLIHCDGHSVTVKGTWPAVNAHKDGRTGIELDNAGMVDLSGLSVDADSFAHSEWVGGGYSFVMIKETNYKSVTAPSGHEPNNPPECPPFTGYISYGIDDEGMNEGFGYQGPRTTYEEQNALETKVVTAILTEGDADSVEGDYGRDYAFWTKLEIDVGNTVLPNQDYQYMTLKPGASLKITGSITLTGGRLGWQVSEYSQLDISGLTLVKKHPSPDMLKISYNPAVGIDTSKLNCKGGGGTIKFDQSDNSYNVTIW